MARDGQTANFPLFLIPGKFGKFGKFDKDETSDSSSPSSSPPFPLSEATPQRSAP